MVEQSGSGAIEAIRSKESVQEILTVAMAFERTAHEFYQQLVGRVSKPMRELVQELADEEQRHYDLLADLVNQPQTQAMFEQKLDRPVHDHQFSNFVHMPELADFVDDQSVFQYAMAREHVAMEQYQALAASAPEGAFKNVFAFLANEEVKHKGELEKRYYALVHRTNV